MVGYCSPADALVLATNKTASSITSVSRVPRDSDGPYFYTRNESSNEFLFRPSGHHSRVSTSSIEAAFLRGLTPQTDRSTVTRTRVARMFRIIWPTLRRMCCSSQSSQSRARRSGAAVSFQPPGANFKTPLCWRNHKDTSCFACAPYKQAERRRSGLKVRRATEGPEDCCPGPSADSVAGISRQKKSLALTGILLRSSHRQVRTCSFDGCLR